MGKSFLALALAEMLDTNFDVDKVVFDLDSFLNYVDKAKPCWIVFDETQVIADKYQWYSVENRIFGQVTETYGKLGINLIMTLPSLAMLSMNGLLMADFFINMLRRGIGRIYMNSKYPLDTHGKFRTRLLGNIVDAEPSDELWFKYEEKKIKYLKEMTKGWKEKYHTDKLKKILTSKRLQAKFDAETNPLYHTFDTKKLLA
jgi:hypothetical protein